MIHKVISTSTFDYNNTFDGRTRNASNLSAGLNSLLIEQFRKILRTTRNI